MGIMDFINGAMNQAQGRYDDAMDDVKNCSARKLCSMLKNFHSIEFSRRNAYLDALNEKAADLDDWELEDLFEQTYRDRNVWAFKIISEEMINRGLAIRDSNNQWHKNY